MIGYLRGLLLSKKPNLIVIDVRGVGYEVHIPLTSFYELPNEGSEVVLKIHTHVREDALILYGFNTQREKDLFLRLISISGIGPKLAITILSGAKVEELAQAVADENVPRLTLIPGVGRKTAERVVLELKGHITPFLLPEHAAKSAQANKTDGLQDDIVSALVNLGYPKVGAERALLNVISAGECDRTFENLLKHTLRRLAG
jgi:holliday junction DNA helicase RuvA